MSPAQLFTLFPLLTPELRIHIWHQALLIPRLVLIWKHNSRDSNHIRRSVASSLLCVNRESRSEALKTYSAPTSIPRSPSAKLPYYIGPGTDIIYIAGTDGERRAFKYVTWTCIFLSQDLDSATPSFAPIRRLAVDEEFLQQTPFFQFDRMPYSVWKLVISDLLDLKDLVVVKRVKEGGWSVRDVEDRLVEAREKFLVFWKEMWLDGEEMEVLEKWKMPVVRVLTLQELVALCWV